jgi:uncharacterized protein YfaS (alpha-2-macroglobulin family)
MRLFLTMWAAVLAVGVSSCSYFSGGDVTVDFGEEIAREQNLTFTFPEPMVPDTMVDRYGDTATYVRFSPAVEGRFQWTSPTQLVFSPMHGFAASTAYTAELTEAVLMHANSTVSMPSRRTFTFHTPWLKITGSSAQWTRNELTGEIEVTVAMTFNYTVDAASVAQHLRLSRNGSSMPFSLRSSGASTDVSIALRGERLQGDDDMEVIATLVKGLRCVESAAPMPETITATLAIPSRTEFEVSAMTPTWEGLDGVINVFTTQAVDASTLLAEHVRISPKVATSTEVTRTGFRIRGPFSVGVDYAVTLSGKIKSVIGSTLTDDVEEQVTFDEMDPDISFASSRAMYLSARGSKGIGVRIVNVPSVRISVMLVYENTIAHVLRQSRTYEWSEDDQQQSVYDVSYMDLDQYADTVFTRVYSTADLGRDANGVAVYSFDVKQHATRKGMYMVKVESTTDQWVNAAKLVAVSDVGLLAKQGLDDLTVFTNSIRDASPLTNVDITLYSTNHQVIDRFATGGNGVLTIRNLRSTLGRFRIGMITARRGDDFTFLYLRDTRVDANRFATGGLHENAAGLQAFIYGDRELYRPGETIHMNTIVRDRAWKPVSGVPVSLVLRAPDGQEVRRLRLVPNAEGSASADISMPTSSLTGMYQAEVFSATDVLLTSRTIAIEEFMPDRLKVGVTIAKQTLTAGEPFDVAIDAAYFTGVPAAKRTYEIMMRLSASSFTASRYPSYHFDVSTGDVDVVRTIERRDSLDDKGRATQRFVIDSALKNMGQLQARFYVTVFDEAGRPVHRFEQRMVRTQPVFFGLKRTQRYVGTRQPVNIPLIACDYSGALASGKVRVRIVRNEWHSMMQDDAGSYSYVTQKRAVTLSDRMMDVSGERSVITFTPTVSGEYEVQVGLSTGGYVTTMLMAFGYGDTQASSFPVNTEGFVDIAMDKPSYRPGETANVLFTTPFAGTLIVTIERDGVLEHHTVKTDKRSASLKLQVKDAWTPNVYVAATLIKPHVETDMPLTVAHGYQSMSVERPSSRLNVSITAPSTSRSRRTQTIDVRTAPGAMVTIAVVDEGIMQVRNTRTPDPHRYFYQKRALQVESHDMYPLLFPELRVRKQTYGAGDDMEMRINPFTVKRADLMTYWSGVIKAPNGRASVKVDLPAFAGAVRVMAVAYKGSSFGSASHMITVTDPLILSTPLPRVVAPGDTVQVPVVLTNTTSSVIKTSCSLTTTGPLKVIGASRQMTLAANRDQVAMFTLVGTGLGAASVTTTATTPVEAFTTTTQIAVRPVSPLTETSASGVVAAGSAADVAVAGGFLAGTGRGRLVVSTFPAIQITRNLARLVEYPYGCVEQTISKAFPQIYVADLVKAWNMAGGTSAEPLKNVQEAVRKIQGMQSWNGGVTYWPGGGDVTWWGTAYAAHFLHEARRAGHEVDNKVLDKMLQYLAERVRARETETIRLQQPDGMQTAKRASRETFYSLFVLAAAGRQDVPTMNYWKSNMSELTQDSRYMLACTYLMLGDRNTYQTVLPSQFREERYRPLHDGSFASPIRDMALALYALVVAAPEDAQTASLARRLSSMLQNEDVFSTQENAFGVLALGRLAQRAARSAATATITQNGRIIASFAGGTTGISVQPGTRVRINASGGSVYYLWVAEGVRSDGRTPIEDRTLQVRRTLLDRNGAVISGNTFTQNQRIIVKVTIRTVDNSVVDNVVISDVLPAGFELENPRLGADDGSAIAKDGSTAKYYDYRDDRMNMFVRADGHARHYYYVVRAVSKGRFRMGPIGADAMYDDDVHSYHGGSVIAVR